MLIFLLMNITTDEIFPRIRNSNFDQIVFKIYLRNDFFAVFTEKRAHHLPLLALIRRRGISASLLVFQHILLAISCSFAQVFWTTCHSSNSVPWTRGCRDFYIPHTRTNHQTVLLHGVHCRYYNSQN